MGHLTHFWVPFLTHFWRGQIMKSPPRVHSFDPFSVDLTHILVPKSDPKRGQNGSFWGGPGPLHGSISRISKTVILGHFGTPKWVIFMLVCRQKWPKKRATFCAHPSKQKKVTIFDPFCAQSAAYSRARGRVLKPKRDSYLTTEKRFHRKLSCH